MKTLYSVLASALIASGSMAVMAQMQDPSVPPEERTLESREQPHGERRDSGSAFSVIDRNGDGVIDRSEASAAGISDSQFNRMDTNGDDTVTESEYRNFVGQNP